MICCYFNLVLACLRLPQRSNLANDFRDSSRINTKDANAAAASHITISKLLNCANNKCQMAFARALANRLRLNCCRRLAASARPVAGVGAELV